MMRKGRTSINCPNLLASNSLCAFSSLAFQQTICKLPSHRSILFCQQHAKMGILDKANPMVTKILVGCILACTLAIFVAM